MKAHFVLASLVSVLFLHGMSLQAAGRGKDWTVLEFFALLAENDIAVIASIPATTNLGAIKVSSDSAAGILGSNDMAGAGASLLTGLGNWTVTLMNKNTLLLVDKDAPQQVAELLGKSIAPDSVKGRKLGEIIGDVARKSRLETSVPIADDPLDNRLALEVAAPQLTEDVALWLYLRESMAATKCSLCLLTYSVPVTEQGGVDPARSADSIKIRFANP